MHILLHDKASKLPCLFPIAHLAVMPCAPGGCGAISFGGRLILVVESRESIIAIINEKSQVIAPAFTPPSDHAKTEAAALEPPTLKEAMQGLRNLGGLIVNAIAHKRRQAALLPIGFPVMFTDDKGSEHFVKTITNAELVELFTHSRTLSCDDLDKATACYKNWLELAKEM